MFVFAGIFLGFFSVLESETSRVGMLADLNAFFGSLFLIVQEKETSIPLLPAESF